MGHRTYGVALVAVAALAVGHAAAVSGAEAGRGSGLQEQVFIGQERLAADATDGLRLTRDADGVVDFAGVSSGNEVANPSVSATTSVRAAADAHLARYGAAFGLERPGTSLTYAGRSATASRQDVVRYDQTVGGVPVIGGEVVVTLRSDRQLGSVLATVSDATAVPPATVSESDAAQAALTVVARTTGLDVADLPVGAEGRWLWDPTVLGATDAPTARGTWRFQVGDGETALHTVLVDDRTRGVLLDVDERQSVLDRVVCDRENEPGDDTSCTSDFARTEASGPAGIADVDNAFVHAGEVADYYQQVAGVDLTQLLGVTVSGVKKLAASVRYCDPDEDCPYANAFWNGAQMFYGEGYAAADDVVGHEMTHGVIDRSSDLFYWGQSGAINESLADVMGEIVDHRNTLVAGDATWPLGEDIPGGPLRNMSNPPSMSDPDRMTSPLYFNVGTADRGGVHFNSGVGNKTAYLISQGGSFNGQTISGIDGSDASLGKTAALYYEVIVRLTSGSDYANLADVLEQACADFVSNGNLHGFTSTDCTNVAKAVTATQLRTTPSNAAQPADAPKGCPTGSYRVLFDSETGTPAAAFTAGSTWLRGSSPLWGSNAVSGHDSWYSSDPSITTTSPLVLSSPISLPAGQPSFLWFQQWRLLDYDGATNYDGGTVEVDNSADPVGPVDASGQFWVNGPADTLVSPNTGRKAFSRDSLGWVASRLDLSAWAGAPVRPQFTMRTDGFVGYVGWWLDDISIYTCDGGTIVTPPTIPTPTPTPTQTPAPAPSSAPSAPRGVKAVGGLGKAVVSWQEPATNPGSVTGYQVSIGDVTKTVTAAERNVTLSALQAGEDYSFKVIAVGSGNFLSPAATVTVRGTATTLKVAKAAGKTKLTGVLKAGSKGVGGKTLKVYAQKGKKWIKVANAKTGKGGKYVLKLRGTTKRKYRVTFLGSGDLMGSQSPKRRL